MISLKKILSITALQNYNISYYKDYSKIFSLYVAPVKIRIIFVVNS